MVPRVVGCIIKIQMKGYGRPLLCFIGGRQQTVSPAPIHKWLQAFPASLGLPLTALASLSVEVLSLEGIPKSSAAIEMQGK